MALAALRARLLPVVSVLGLLLGLLVISAGPAEAVSCPSVDPNTHVVSPAAAPHDDWSGCDLTGADLGAADLASATLSGAILHDASLVNANLSNSSLDGADLSEADLTGAELISSNMGDANLSGAAIGTADLTTVTLTGANLEGTDLSSAALSGVRSGGITATTITLPAGWLLAGGYLAGPQANLTGAALHGADLSGADLNFAIVTGADLSAADLSGANLNADLSGADLSGANLDGADLSGATLSGVQSGGITGHPAFLPANWVLLSGGGYLAGPFADLADASLAGATLTGLSLYYANLSGADLAGADLSGATMYYANLDDATLIGAHFDGTDLTGAKLDHAHLSGSSLTSADLQIAVLTGADLSGADLSGASLRYANLTGAILANASLHLADLFDATLTSAAWSNTTCPDDTNSDTHAPPGCTTPHDSAAPVANPLVTAGHLGTNGWYTSAVTVSWNWSDDGVINPAACVSASQAITQGNPVTLAGTCKDKAGNQGQASDPVKIDRTPPSVSVTGVRSGRQYIFGKVPAAGCTTTDALSGVATRAKVSVTTSGRGSVGTFTATCHSATDLAGNRQAHAVSLSYRVVYGFGGFGSPRPGSTLRKADRVIKVAFRLVSASGRPISAATAAALAAVGKVHVTLTGPGISAVTAVCGWNDTDRHFGCVIRTPSGVITGSGHPYALTVTENVGPGFIRAPAVGQAVNPETIHFS